MTLINALFAWMLSLNPMAPVSTPACTVDVHDIQPCSNGASTEEEADEDEGEAWVWGVRPWLDRNHGISNGI